MMLLAFPVFLSLIGIASAASSVPDCGERGSRWLADFHHQGWRGPAGCLPIIDRLNLEVKDEIGS